MNACASSTPPEPKGGPWIPITLAAYMALMSALSHFSQPPLPEDLLRLSDKVLHVAEYCPLGFLWTLAFRARGRRAALLGLVAAALFGISDEIHQSFVPGRDSSLLDVAADMAGAGLGSALALPLILAGQKKRNLTSSP